jgi:predicted NACHT family NTPase
MPATLHQWLRVHSRATDACLFYLDRVIKELGRQPLLNDFGRSLEKNGLRRPLSVEPYDAARFHDRSAQEERERNNVTMRAGDADAERRLYAHRSGMDDQLREERARPESLDPLLDTLEVAMLLGDPGSGKSECLKGLAVRVATAIRDELETALKLPDEVRLPVFADLPEVARLFGETEEESQLRAFVWDWLMPITPDGRPSQETPPLDHKTRLLAAILKAATTRLNQDKADMEACIGALRRIWQDWFSPTLGLPHPSGALILLDAWDEIAERHRTDEFKRALCALSERPHVRLVATSRILGFEAGILDSPPSAGPGEFRRTLVILPFRDKEVTKFIKAFFTQSTTADLLIQDIATKPMVMGMIQNPLLATLVCLAFDPSAPNPVALPARRAQVYQAVVDRLLGEAEARRKAGVKLKKEAAVQIQGTLQSLAFHYFPDEVFNEAKVAEFCEKHRPRPGTALAKHLGTSDQTLFDCLLGSGLLARHGADELRFLHLTFQEFFAAGYLARAVEQQGWESAAVPVRGIDKPVKVSLLIDKKGWHPRWQEVIALTAGLLDPVEAPVEPLLETLMACQDSIHHHRLCLAVLCLAEAQRSDRSIYGTTARIGEAAWTLLWRNDDSAVSDPRIDKFLGVTNPLVDREENALDKLAIRVNLSREPLS